ncbi:ribosome recycling factor family protein [Vibrio hannami]|uniref:ribosome recycling factor family protein n=1 Tax=Vibrio hannami TaxID=2717094 RepID=UPI00240EC460|nr:ribosome recycling factor family protein [Vibrio hannami]MDG3087897.1 ribosome recycling factor family protein [Vibrio hannami]
MSDKAITIALPSLIHRIGGEQAKRARSLAENYHCKLSRVRRSRNWQITGLAIKQSEFCEHIKSTEPETMAFLVRKLEEGLERHKDKLEPKEERLRRIITENPNITLNELMAMTNCSISETRKARFDNETY